VCFVLFGKELLTHFTFAASENARHESDIILKKTDKKGGNEEEEMFPIIFQMIS
jgi:hypothetical protein